MVRKFIPNYFIKFLLKSGILALIYTLCRILFLILNNDHFPIVYFTDFIAGFWFDLVTAAIVCLPLLALELFPNKWRGKKGYQIVLALSFNIILFLTVLINLIDIEYFKHTSSRSTASLIKMLGFGDDLMQQMPSFLTDYWYLLLFLLLFQLIGIWLYRRINRIKDDSAQRSWIHQIIVFPIAAALFVIIGRGGFGLKPIAAPKAASYTIDQNIQLVLNSAFTVIKTWGNIELEEKEYFTSDELVERYNPIHQFSSDPVLNQPNIVILLMESFSVEYIASINGDEVGYTPFLDSLIDSSLVFTNCYANGKKSMDAMPSVISSIPKLMEIEYLTSSYAANQIESLPKILSKKGYESGFFHGATNGSMNFDVFADVTGFDNYYGRSEYNNDKDFDGTWGIFDEPFLDWSVDQMSGFKTPFFSTIFTISSHPPYAIPKQYKNRFNQGPSEMHDAVRYADYALSTFFEKAKKTDWYANTLFVIVADHTPASGTPIYFKDMGNMHIPLVFYHPTNPFFRGRNDKIVSQTDIMPTLLDLMGHHEPFFAFGQSIFDDLSGVSASYIGDKFIFFATFEEERYMLLFQDEAVLGIFSLNDVLQTKNLLENSKLSENMVNQLKAMIQTYNHALIRNEMTVK